MLSGEPQNLRQIWLQWNWNGIDAVKFPRTTHLQSHAFQRNKYVAGFRATNYFEMVENISFQVIFDVRNIQHIISRANCDSAFAVYNYNPSITCANTNHTIGYHTAASMLDILGPETYIGHFAEEIASSGQETCVLFKFHLSLCTRIP